MARFWCFRLRWGTAKSVGLAVLAAVLLVGARTPVGEKTTAARARCSFPAPTDTIRRAREGAPVPDFAVEHLRDSTRTFEPSDFEGRYVLLNLWATWCAPCIEKIPALQQARERYSPDTLALLNISFDRSRATVGDFLKDRSMPGLHAFAGISELGGALGAKFARLPGKDASMRALPSLTLVGPDGEVVAILPAPADTGLLEMLKKHLS